MARRELAAQYRGSLGDLAWTVLHPLLLMLTYFFVFGIVLRARLGGDSSPSSYALYFLAGTYSEERLGGQTLLERRTEFDLWEKLLDADSAGELARYFLDKSVLADWLERARRRKTAIETFFKTAPTRPTASFTRSNAGWTAALFMPEAATDISYRLGETGEFKSTGLSPMVDQRTGKPVDPNYANWTTHPNNPMARQAAE